MDLETLLILWIHVELADAHVDGATACGASVIYVDKLATCSTSVTLELRSYLGVCSSS